MSRVVFICFRDARPHVEYQVRIERLNSRLSPDNITPAPAWLAQENGIIAALLNPSDAVVTENTSICLGTMINPAEDWGTPGAALPNGSYAIFRGGERQIELLTDSVASRTIWYLQTDEVFIASSSQRAIVALLGDFQPNRAAFSWMISSGTLGPENAWDKRIRCVPPDARLLLDRGSWSLRLDKAKADFTPQDLPAEEHAHALKERLETVFENLQFDYARWVLPLSGGFDSRTILLMLKNREQIQSITWGVMSALDDKLSDAYIAKQLAQTFNLKHKYFVLDMSSDESLERLFNRYLVAGEGRVDNISAYMDGFKIWKTLYDEGYSGVLRGDEGFGWVPVFSLFDVTYRVGMLRLHEYANLPQYRDFELPEQVIPEALQQKSDETPLMWRDRLYHEFRIPVVLAALNELKCSFVEIINPLISRSLIEYVRVLPDHLRTDKKLFRDIVTAMSPDIAFAQRSALGDRDTTLQTRQIVTLFQDELHSSHAQSLLASPLTAYITQNLKVTETYSPSVKVRAKRFLKQILPKKVIDVGRSAAGAPNPNINTWALRAFIICRMNRLLQEDAGLFKD